MTTCQQGLLSEGLKSEGAGTVVSVEDENWPWIV